jgi:hypothetical protein
MGYGIMEEICGMQKVFHQPQEGKDFNQKVYSSFLLLKTVYHIATNLVNINLGIPQQE